MPQLAPTLWCHLFSACYLRRRIAAIATTALAVAAFIASAPELCDQSVLRLLHRRAGEFGIRDVGHPWIFEKDEVDASE